MNRFLATLALAGALTLVGCSKKNSNNPVTPNQPAGATVTFTMHMESGTQGMIFVASPSEDVRITKVEVSFPAQQFHETVTNPTPATVFPRGSTIQIGEYTGIETHQQWVLVFYGTIASTGKPFTVTVNWDVV
jgi:hypothetical protein